VSRNSVGFGIQGSTLRRNLLPPTTTLISWIWRQQIPPKCWWLSTKIHGVTSQPDGIHSHDLESPTRHKCV